ncbi:MAG: DUF1194 domain-containing protein [Maricaulaceae bacterium]|jgi:hypothetical protein
MHHNRSPRRRAPIAPGFAGLAAAVFAACALGAPAAAQIQRVDLELVLAVDVSQSMDSAEHRLQRQGYVEAFRHDEVIEAILFGPRGRIAVTYVEWGEDYYQRQVVPWTIIDSRESALAFADELEAEALWPGSRTSISNALYQSAHLLETNNIDGSRMVIDVSGDGPNNTGPWVDFARDDVGERGITVNGLPIMLREAYAWYDIENLDEYYEDCVITGPGAFVAPVRSLEELGPTIRGKLVLEIASLPSTVRYAQFTFSNEPEEEKANCQIGEMLWQTRGGGFGFQ